MNNKNPPDLDCKDDCTAYIDQRSPRTVHVNWFKKIMWLISIISLFICNKSQVGRENRRGCAVDRKCDTRLQTQHSHCQTPMKQEL